VPGTLLGFGAGLLAGAALGCGEAWLVLAGSASEPDYAVLAYGTGVYALVLGCVGAAFAFFSAWSGRLMQREAVSARLAYARGAAFLFAVCGLAIGAFRVRRDYFHEELVWKSPAGLAVLVGCFVCAVVVYGVLSLVLRQVPGFLLRAWGTPLFVGVLVLLLGAAGALAGPSGRSARVARPQLAASNILLVVVDTLRADRLPSYGYRTGRTPALDGFAADALRFDAAFANASWTRPSFASILSGRFAASHRTMAKSDALPSEITTLPEALQTGGYETLGVVTNYNIAPFFNFHQGFDEYRYLEPSFVLGANDTAAKLLLIQALRQSIESWRAKRGRIEVGSAYQPAPTVTGEVLRWLDRKRDAPFFMLAAYMDPHDPYYPHPYDGTAYARAAHQKPAPDEAPKLSELYDGEISYWDESFGQLIAALKQRGLYDAMTIVVTSDHGEEFFEHGGYWHGTTLYDEALHVPLFVKLPKALMRGTVLRHMVQSIDIMPTLLKLAALPIPAGVQGQDMFDPHDSVFAEESHEGNVLRALRMERSGSTLKLIEANPGNPRGLSPRELYQVDQDPGEQVNLLGERPELLQLSVQALEREAHGAAEGRATQKSVNISSDRTVAERLRALGYAGGDKRD
jgi:arylsulfatase A-like enzyme